MPSRSENRTFGHRDVAADGDGTNEDWRSKVVTELVEVVWLFMLVLFMCAVLPQTHEQIIYHFGELD